MVLHQTYSMIRFFSFSLLLLSLSTSLCAQALYTVQVGTFMDIRHADFDELRPIGFVFGTPMEGNITQVYLGNYTDIGRAEAVANQLKARGFKNAVVLQRPTAASQPVVIIQLSTQNYSKRIEWETLERAGNIFVENDDQLLKIASGIYPDIATAQGLLPSVKALGYPDAFVKTIDPARLIPIGSFETGIKKPLIPIDLTQKTPEPQATAAVVAPAPALYGSPQATGSALTASSATAANLPAIRSRFKRESATKLQTLLKEKGYYTDAIDGYYGSGTAAAYQTAWDNMEELQMFHLLRAALQPSQEDVIARWPEISLLLSIAQQLSAGRQDDRLLEEYTANRLALVNRQEPVGTVAATRSKNWESTLWNNVNIWATEDPLHARFVSAFRFAYYQSEVRLEDHYMDRGLPSDAAKELAVATLQNLLGGYLVRFL